jgi:iron complex outermembrane recepter protein
LLPDRSTSSTGVFAQAFRTSVDNRVRTWSVYASSTTDVTERVSLALAGRFDGSLITLSDRTGENPELNGRHRFGRFNPAVSSVIRLRRGLTAFVSLGQSSRTPTAVELACAEESAPCSLPNAFLADPPLAEVVTRSAEIGLRGERANGLKWHFGAYWAASRDDILFQTTGGPQANVGFFANASDTSRNGVELELSQRIGRWAWKATLAGVDATYQDSFVLNSPNHPLFENSDDDAGSIVGDGKLRIDSGDRIPGIARYQMNVNASWGVTSRLRLGADFAFRSGVYLRGDEINALGRTASYRVVDLRADFQVTEIVSVYARVENAFQQRYETFGLLGEPDEVFENFRDPRFLGAGPPRGAWVGLRARF